MGLIGMSSPTESAPVHHGQDGDVRNRCGEYEQYRRTCVNVVGLLAVCCWDVVVCHRFRVGWNILCRSRRVATGEMVLE